MLKEVENISLSATIMNLCDLLDRAFDATLLSVI